MQVAYEINPSLVKDPDQRRMWEAVRRTFFELNAAAGSSLTKENQPSPITPTDSLVDYFYLPGRVSGQVAYGGTQPGDTLSLRNTEYLGHFPAGVASNYERAEIVIGQGATYGARIRFGSPSVGGTYPFTFGISGDAQHAGSDFDIYGPGNGIRITDPSAYSGGGPTLVEIICNGVTNVFGTANPIMTYTNQSNIVFTLGAHGGVIFGNSSAWWQFIDQGAIAGTLSARNRFNSQATGITTMQLHQFTAQTNDIWQIVDAAFTKRLSAFDKDGYLALYDSDGSDAIKFKAAAVTTAYTLTWPGADAAGVLTSNGTGMLSFAATAPAAAHDILSATHADTLASAVSRGSLIYGNSTPKWAELNIGAAGYYLRSDGTDVAWYNLFGSAQTINADWITTGTLTWQYAGSACPFRVEYDTSVLVGNVAEWYDSASAFLTAYIDAGGTFNIPNLVIFNGSNKATISCTPTAARAIVIPDVSGNVIMSAGTQTVGGTKTLTGNNTHSGNVVFSNSIKVGSASVAISTITHGTYTPTLTGVANVAASTAYQCQWMQVGTMVHVSGKLDVDPTAAAATQLGISLPVASNLGAAEDCAGTACASAVASECAAITGDAANNRAEMTWVTVSTANHSMYFTFMYEVI